MLFIIEYDVMINRLLTLFINGFDSSFLRILKRIKSISLNKIPSNIRLWISDIDGTLIPSNKILTEETICAAQNMQQAGVKLSLVSSRPASGMRMYLQQLQLKTPFSALNGGEILDAEGKILFKINIASSVVKDICQLLQRHNVEVWFYGGLDWFVFSGESDFVHHEEKSLNIRPRIISDIQDHVNDIVKIMGVSKDTVSLDHLAKQINQDYGKEVIAVHSSVNYLDISHVKANKGFAAQKLSELLNVPLDKTACIGDMDNDIAMLKIAGTSIAMGQAKQNVKQYAQFVTRTNEENGWAYAVHHFLF